ncbi:MAG: BON domain-containing protein [Pseudomonadota bacterium]
MKYQECMPKNSVVIAVFLSVFIAMALMVMSTLYAAGVESDAAFEHHDRSEGHASSKVVTTTVRRMSPATFDEVGSNHVEKLGKDGSLRAQSISERRKMAKYVEDSVITAKVKTRLIKHSLLKGVQIHVQTYKGAVLLSGFVDNSKQVVAAGRIAAGIEGVTKVINSLVPKAIE